MERIAPGARGASASNASCTARPPEFSNQKLLAELDTEVEKAKEFEPRLHHFVFATTAPHSAALQERAAEITQEHRPKGLFSVEFKGWASILPRFAGEEAPSLYSSGELCREKSHGGLRWVEPDLPQLRPFQKAIVVVQT
jgi:hypothetical protein